MSDAIGALVRASAWGDDEKLTIAKGILFVGIDGLGSAALEGIPLALYTCR